LTANGRSVALLTSRIAARNSSAESEPPATEPSAAAADTAAASPGGALFAIGACTNG
jgi:hypothetical protein